MPIPLLVTDTVDPGLVIAVLMNHGIPRQTRMSKTLLPIALLTAMSPCPVRVGERKEMQNMDLICNFTGPT